MQTLLVTGGVGFIGGCFVRQSVAEHTIRVVNLDKLTYAGNLDSLAMVIDDPLLQTWRHWRLRTGFPIAVHISANRSRQFRCRVARGPFH